MIMKAWYQVEKPQSCPVKYWREMVKNPENLPPKTFVILQILNMKKLYIVNTMLIFFSWLIFD